MPHKITKGRPGRPANFLVDSEVMSSDTSLNAELGNVTPGTLAHTVGFAAYKEKALDNSWADVVIRGKGTPTTVTGVAPLLLAAALNKPLKSLTQYGLCSQASTPTPSSPVNIVCNNGALTMVDDELPIGYKRLLGITFDGNFHYRTGEALTGDDNVTMTLDNLSASGKNVFGSYNGANDKNFSMYIYGSSTSGSYFRYGDQLKRPKYGGTGRRTITFGASGTSGFAEDSDVTLDEFTTPANTYIGMLPNSSSAAYTGDIVGSILVSNRLEWIPTERETDGVIGYYEKYNGNFIAPTGSGTPVSLGYDGSHYSLSVVGTDEVISITASGADTQTASAPDLFAVGDYADEVNIISGAVKRKIGIKVLDGTETWVKSSTLFRSDDAIPLFNRSAFAPICTHYVPFEGGLAPQSNSNIIRISYLSNGSIYRLFIYADLNEYATADDFKAFLAEQYAAGTPVIIIYPLADETTESVMAQPLSTAAGDNTITATANVSPITLAAVYMKKKE